MRRAVKSMLVFAWASMLMLSAAAFPARAAIGTTDIGRYLEIVNRKPFGELAPAEDTASEPVATPREPFATHLELRAIIDDGITMRAGFFDTREQKSFSLMLGETVDGIELVSVDYDNEEALLRQGTETSLIRIRPDSAAGQAARAEADDRAAHALARRRPFFTQREGSEPSGIKPVEPITPFRGKTIEDFLREHPEAALQRPSPLRPVDPDAPAGHRGPTIENFIEESPDADRRFSPFRPHDPTTRHEGRGEAIERFMREHSGEHGDMRTPPPFSQQPESFPFLFEEVPVDEIPFYEFFSD